MNPNQKQPSLRLLLGVTLCIGLLYTFLTYSPSFLLGSGPYWEARIGDPAVHLTGTRFYIRDVWRLPLFEVASLNYPEGTNIIFTDSLPFAALFAKVLYKITGIEWNYFGPWVLLSNLCFGISILLLLLSLGVRSLAVMIVTQLIGYCSFAFVYPVTHIALSSHFVLILALSFYFFSSRGTGSRGVLWGFPVLLAVCLWVHVYLFVMVFLIATVTLLDGCRRCRWSKKTAFVWMVLVLAGLLALMVLGGHLSVADSAGYKFITAGSRGSMDLVSPFWPPYVSPLHVPLLLKLTGKAFYRRNMFYLGMAVIVLWFFILIRYPKSVWKECRKHPILLLLCLALFLFSLSWRIRFAGYEIVNLACIPKLKELFLIFRGMGRFFWPVLYLLLLLPTVLIWKFSRHRKEALLFLFGFAVLQNLEIFPLRMQIRHKTSQAAYIEDAEFYKAEVKKHELILIDVDETRDVPQARRFIWYVYFMAGKYNIPINFSPTARIKNNAESFDTVAREAIRENIQTLLIVPFSTFKSLNLSEDLIIHSKDDLVFVSFGRDVAE